MRPVLPADLLLIDQLHVGFVDKRRWLEGVIRSLASQIAPCEPSKLIVDNRQYLIDDVLTAAC